jgi:hypothetical protein
MAGDFDNVPPGLTDVNNIAIWDGITWRSPGTTTRGANSDIYSMAIFGNQLHIGGQFTSAGGVAGTSRVARWNATTWSALTTGTNGSVRAMAVINNRLVLAGAFSSVGSLSAPGVARWTGSSWQSFAVSGQGTGPDDTAWAVTSSNGETVFGGEFNRVAGRRAWNLARWSDLCVSWITQQPVNVAAVPGGTAILSATPANGYNGLTVQWQRQTSPGVFVNVANGAGGAGSGGGTLAGATGPAPVGTLLGWGQTAHLIITGAQPADAGVYQVTFTNACGTATSVPVTLTVQSTGCGPSDVARAGPLVGPDGELTADDIIVFIGWFVNGDIRADVARTGQQPLPDGEFTADDVIVFINRFIQGC